MKIKNRPNKWLVIDGHNLAWRSFHAIKSQPMMSLDNIRTEVVYIFLSSMIHLQRIHNTKRIVFCFDRKPTKRLKIYPDYKSNRRKRKRERSEKEKEQEKHFRDQLRILRTSILPSIGYKNIFAFKGYEADDIIAKIVKDSIGPKDEAVIISSDHDLFQLLNTQVWVWNPITREAMTSKHFRKSYGIKPKQWAEMKAIAGCSSDFVKGVVGVGDLTALRYLRKELMEHSKAYIDIQNSTEVIARNRELVTLPIAGLPEIKLLPDTLNRENWGKITDKLSIYSLEDALY